MRLGKPIFIIGVPRSGTTILFQVMASHSELGYINSFVNRYPNFPQLGAIDRIYDFPVLGNYLYRQQRFFRWLPSPREPWISVNKYLSKFQLERGGIEKPRPRTAIDITEDESEKFREFVSEVLEYQGKKRFILKYTDFPRIEYLSSIFPNAIFIHLVRDGRGVANSYLNQINDGGFDTWKEKEWWLSGWPEEWSKRWKSEYNTKLTFCAFQYKYFLNEIERQSENLQKNRFFLLKYEQLTEGPQSRLKTLLPSLELHPEDTKFNKFLKEVELEDRNYKWKEELTPEEKATLNDILEGKLNKYGYI